MTDPATASQPRKRRGCLFYGCLTVLVLFLVLCLVAFLAIRWFQNQINAYTDTAPMTLPKVEMADEEFKALEQRAKTFGEAMDQGRAVEPLILNEREINALLARVSDAKELTDKVYVAVTNSEVKGLVSIPLSGLGRLGKGRYLNGEATFNVSLENGVLIVTASEIQVKGRRIPESFMKRFRQENLAKEAYKDPKNAEAIRKFESIQVDDSRVIIKARAAQ